MSTRKSIASMVVEIIEKHGPISPKDIAREMSWQHGISWRSDRLINAIRRRVTSGQIKKRNNLYSISHNTKAPRKLEITNDHWIRLYKYMEVDKQCEQRSSK